MTTTVRKAGAKADQGASGNQIRQYLGSPTTWASLDAGWLIKRIGVKGVGDGAIWQRD